MSRPLCGPQPDRAAGRCDISRVVGVGRKVWPREAVFVRIFIKKGAALRSVLGAVGAESGQGQEKVFIKFWVPMSAFAGIGTCGDEKRNGCPLKFTPAQAGAGMTYAVKRI